MRVYRICRRAHSALDGEGARRIARRWNLRGTAVVYAAESIALAVLEVLVHTEADMLPADLVLLEIDVPDEVSLEIVSESDLPADWQSYPGSVSLQGFGSTWAKEQRTAVLSVPSVIVPQERNFLLNPVHPDFKRIIVVGTEPFHFDPRLRT